MNSTDDLTYRQLLLQRHGVS